MTLTNRMSTRRRRVQFSLATLLAIVTALSVFLSVGRWLGWQIVLYLADLAGLLAVTSLPFVVVLLGRSNKGKGGIGGVIVVAGVLLVVHFVATVLSVELLLREPFVLDLVPFDGVMDSTLNCSLPSAAAGLLIALAFGKRIWRIPAFWIGGTLIAAGALAFVWYGHYFFGELLGDSLANNVWWL
jgi:hypothetical protein